MTVTAGACIPEIGEPDPAALDYLNRAYRLIPDTAQFRRHGLPPAPLKRLVQDEAEAIRKQAPFRAAVIAAVAAATGIALTDDTPTPARET